jgi:ATP-dependent DNA helicase RecQ
VLLPGEEDAAIWRYFASLAFPPEEQVRTTLAALDPDRPTSTAALETRVELRRTRLEMMLKVLDVDGAVRRVRGGWVGTGRPWHYDTRRHERVAQARTDEQAAMRRYVATGDCRMLYLRRCLDDPDAAPCGRCDRCAGPPLPDTVGDGALAAARAALGRPGVVLDPRRQWPTGLAAVGVELKGRIPPGEQAEPGRVLGRLSDLGWGNRLRPLLAGAGPGDGTGDRAGPLPREVADAVVAVLAEWARGDQPWGNRPVAVVGIASARRPGLVEALAGHIARVGRLPHLGELTVSAEAGRANSAQRVRALHEAFTLPPGLAAELSTLDGPVLLVDDYVDSGWTMALAARLLRRAGAPGVLPFALAQNG